jgi:nitric oxide reductase subunit B
MPGRNYSYTLNFPYEPLTDNYPPAEAIVWTALSPLALLIGTGVILLAFGRYDFLGWKGRIPGFLPAFLPERPTASQRATIKYFVVVTLLFLAQVLVGGAMAHYRTGAGSFFGFDLTALLPTTILRTWHLQTAIFWIVTAYAGGGLFLASSLGMREQPRQALGVHILWTAVVLVAFGSLLGEFAGIQQLIGRLWFWFGLQGWEYLELGRAWQYLLLAGLVFWVFLLVRATAPARAPCRTDAARPRSGHGCVRRS